MLPTIGRVVHYQSYGTPGGEYLPEPRAAISSVDVRPRGQGLTTVKLISTGSPSVTVSAGWNA